MDFWLTQQQLGESISMPYPIFVGFIGLGTKDDSGF